MLSVPYKESSPRPIRPCTPRSASGSKRPFTQPVPGRDRDEWCALLSSSGAYIGGKALEGSWESGRASSSRKGSKGSNISSPSVGSSYRAVSLSHARQCADSVLNVLQSPRDFHAALQKGSADAQTKTESEKQKPSEKSEKLSPSRLTAATAASSNKKVKRPPRPKKTENTQTAQSERKLEGNTSADAKPENSVTSHQSHQRGSFIAMIPEGHTTSGKRGSLLPMESEQGGAAANAPRGSVIGGQGKRFSVMERNARDGAGVDHKDHSQEKSIKHVLEKETEEGKSSMRVKMGAKCFEADLSSFQDLVNVESNPIPISAALENLESIAGGGNFVWERRAEWANGHGASVNFHLQLILWYPNSSQADVKTGISSNVSFLHKPGCAYVYQPVLPVTSLQISPRSKYMPMFDEDPRSFHIFKLAWRHYLDFGVSDYRIIVGEQLDQWTQRLQSVIEKPLNAVYWLMLMVGSHYRETLVSRSVLKGFEECPERVPVICVDSFVSLSALLFSPERQVLYAGTDPTPSYLQWLQFVADQGQHRKDPQARKSLNTVFEMNETLDLSVIIVFFGRIQMKVKESAQFSWVGNPNLIKAYIRKYAEDNCCCSQLEQAIRLYTYSCALGEMRSEDGSQLPSTNEGENWYCWNGLKVCEIGVPMPSTQATFLSPFLTCKSIALLCPIHGPDAKEKAKEKQQKKPPDATGKEESTAPASRRTSTTAEQVSSSLRPSRPSSRNSRRSVSSIPGMGGGSSKTPSVKDDSTGLGGSSETDGDSSDEFDIFTESLDSGLPTDGGGSGGRGGKDEGDNTDDRQCSCVRYAKATDAEKKGRGRRKHHGHLEESDPEMIQALQSLGEYDVMHCFVAVLNGTLNHAKQIIRLHFSIDPAAYTHLPMPGRVSWPDGMIPWYREFHRPDAHGRSRYAILLESVVRGLVGDGYTSGFREEALDMIRAVSQESSNFETEPSDRRDKTETLQMKTPDADYQVGQSKKSVNLNTQNLRRPSSLYLGPQRNRSSSVMHDHLQKEQDVQQQHQQQPLSPSTASTTAPSTSSGPTHSQHSAVSSKPTSQTKGAIGELVLWAELYECESLYNHRSHFETFTQWCHSAHLIAFLKRCYRRCGVAGLLPGQRCGGLHVQGNPSYPLVLPTIPNFPYGHGFPLHRVLEYFYGGVTTIVASITDQQVAEEMRAPLGLIAGQERLNNQCWFQLTPQEQEALNAITLEGQTQQESRTSAHGGNLNQMLLQQLEDYMSGRASINSPKKDASVPGSNQVSQGHGELSRGRSFTGVPGAAPEKPAEPSPNAASRRSGLAHKKSILAQHATTLAAPTQGKKRLTAGGSSAAIPTLKKYERKNTLDKVSKRKHARAPPRIGTFVPEDPFFWFCSQNFALHTYPAEKIPKHFLPDGSCLLYRYSDFVSRTGTPDNQHPHADNHGHGHSLHRESSVRSNEEWDSDTLEPVSRSICRQVVPPAICLCQPTDLMSHNRQRWEVKKDFVDEQQLILGDSGWWPGALGNRFDFETQLENVDKYVNASEVPQTRLLYIEYLMVQREKRDQKTKVKGQAAPNADDPFDSGCSTTDSESESDTKGTSGAKQATRGPHKKAKAEGKAETSAATPAVVEDSSSLMLPPLLHMV